MDNVSSLPSVLCCADVSERALAMVWQGEREGESPGDRAGERGVFCPMASERSAPLGAGVQGAQGPGECGASRIAPAGIASPPCQSPPPKDPTPTPPSGWVEGEPGGGCGCNMVAEVDSHDNMASRGCLFAFSKDLASNCNASLGDCMEDVDCQSRNCVAPPGDYREEEDVCGEDIVFGGLGQVGEKEVIEGFVGEHVIAALKDCKVFDSFPQLLRTAVTGTASGAGDSPPSYWAAAATKPTSGGPRLQDAGTLPGFSCEESNF